MLLWEKNVSCNNLIHKTRDQFSLHRKNRTRHR